MSQTYVVHVKRCDPGRNGPYEVTYTVPKGGLYRVLDVLFHIYDHIDATLGFRRELCREGFCHSCEAKVNGKRVLTCLTLVSRLDEITIEPLDGYPVVRDLVVEFGHEIHMLDPKRRIITDLDQD